MLCNIKLKLTFGVFEKIVGVFRSGLDVNWYFHFKCNFLNIVNFVLVNIFEHVL